MKHWILVPILIFVVCAKGLRAPERVDGSKGWMVMDAESAADKSEPSSWQEENALDEPSHPQAIADTESMESPARSSDREPFDESILSILRPDRIPIETICHDSYMEVFVPIDVFGMPESAGSNIVMLHSACRLEMEVNATHLVFNHPYTAFSEQPCSNPLTGSCCSNLVAISYAVGVVYAFEVPVDIFAPDTEPRQENLSAYCYFKSPKHDQTVKSHASIKLFASMYDRVGVSRFRWPLAFDHIAYLKIVSEEGLSDMENFPVNCWLSPHALKLESSENMVDSIFLKDGCPVHKDALVTTIDVNRELRVGFSLAADKKQEKFLYVHCEYIKCLTSETVNDTGKLPPCPRHDHCIRGGPIQYEPNQLSIATSDVVLERTRNAPQFVMPAAPKIVTDRPCNPVECRNGIADHQPQCNHVIWVTVLVGFSGFAIGIIFTLIICCIKQRSRVPVETVLPIRSDKETSFGGFQALLNTIHSPQGAPDVLAQTPESKRVYLCQQPARRQRHLAGHDGYQPPNPADSMMAADFSRVGETTIALKDESWNRKIQLHDDKD